MKTRQQQHISCTEMCLESLRTVLKLNQAVLCHSYMSCLSARCRRCCSDWVHTVCSISIRDAVNVQLRWISCCRGARPSCHLITVEICSSLKALIRGTHTGVSWETVQVEGHLEKPELHSQNQLLHTHFFINQFYCMFHFIKSCQVIYRFSLN